ncbi:MAG: transcriptional repressor LexA, partial [Patescibacteria group bacterium]
MITKKQQQVLDFIEKYQKKNTYSPSLQEIQKRFKLASVSTAHYYVKQLEKKDFLLKEGNQHRSINVLPISQMVQVPLLGTIAAGQPIEATQEKESIAVPKNKIPNSGDVYALRVSGSSMIDENINDGDIVLIKQQTTAENGQKVVALIDNNSATLKKFYKEKNSIRLDSANKLFKPIIIQKDRDIKIQGVVLDVIQNEKTPSRQAVYTSNSNKIIYPETSIFKRKLINNLNDLTAQEWIQETISVFNQKGLGAGHEDTKIERQHPAPFSFQDVGRLIKFFTKRGQRVLDPFNGVGSTLKACAVNGREGVGIELVKKYVDLTKERLQKELGDDLFGSINKNQKTIYGDALKKIKDFKDDHFDFIVTSPPYWNILSKKADHKVKQE